VALRQAVGFALRTRPLGEADLIVEIFTLERGRIRAVAKSARRIRSRFGSAFEPFTRSRIVWYQKDKDDLGRMSSCDIERSYFESLGTVEAASTASYLSELVIGFTPEQDPAPTVFRLIDVSLEAIAAGTSAELIARYFEVWILRLSGLFPDLSSCSGCGGPLGADLWVSDVTLEFLCGRACSEQRGRARLTPGAVGLLTQMLRRRPGDLEAPAGGAAAGDLRSLAAVTEVMICGHLDRAPRSLRVMRRLAADRH
jgi:DNA repair protein RecO (recombination protein O)